LNSPSLGFIEMEPDGQGDGAEVGWRSTIALCGLSCMAN